MSLRVIPAPVWFVAALIPMVVSQIIRLRQADPAMWIFWDYAGRLGALAALAAIPAARAVAFRREGRRIGLWEAALWVAGMVLAGNVGFAEAVLEIGEVQAAARTLGLEVAPLEIRRAEDIPPAFEVLKAQADALYVAQDALVAANRTSILTLALRAGLPTVFGTRDFVQAGALMSYGPNFPDQFRRAAELVDSGTKPGDIPVEQPTKFELVLNLSTAKALGLTVPHSLLARADEVIE